jgi:peptide/nickel transport system substrate-binding protein
MSGPFAGRTRRDVTLGFIAVALTVPLMAACSSSKSSSSTASSVLKVGVASDVVDWDPQTSTTLGDQQILENVYRGLTVLNPSTKQPVGELASSWTTSADGLTWTFALRPTAKFSNGKPVLATDVVYSMQRILKPATKATSASDLAPVRSVTASGTESVTFHLSKPYSLLPTVLQYPAWSAIIPADSGSTIANTPVGAGPFELASKTSQTEIVLKKSPDYWNASKIRLSEVDFKVIPDENSREAALTSGQIDLDPSVGLSDAKRLESNSALKVQTFTSSEVDEFGMNAKKGPFADVRVRQAVAYALDRTALAKVATFGLGKPATSMDSPASPISVNAQDSIPHDTAKAKQLLAAAGFANGLTFTFSACGGTAFPAMIRAGQVITSDLAGVGVKAKFVTQDAGVWADQVITKGNYDAFVCGLISGNDPDQHSYKYFTSTGQYNFSHFTGPAELDQLLNQGRQVTDVGKRSGIYSQAFTILNQQVPWIPLYTVPGIVAYRKQVQGFVPFPELNLRLELVTGA